MDTDERFAAGCSVGVDCQPTSYKMYAVNPCKTFQGRSGPATDPTAPSVCGVRCQQEADGGFSERRWPLQALVYMKLIDCIIFYFVRIFLFIS
jgi:hypothetical protein